LAANKPNSHPVEHVETVAQLYGYTAREQDAESPLYYYRSRYYDPRTGRFTQEDRIGFDGNDINIYRYVANNPVNLNDPSGEFPIGIAIGGVSGFLGAVAQGGSFGDIVFGTLSGAALGAINPGAALTNNLGRAGLGAAGRLLGGALDGALAGALGNTAGQLFWK